MAPTFDRDAAMQIAEDMLLVCQKLASNVMEGIEAAGDPISTEIEEKMAEEMFPWLMDDRDIRPLLCEIVAGEKPLDGLGVYNLMTIAHRLCPAIAALAPLRLPEGRDLPEPDISWLLLKDEQ